MKCTNCSKEAGEDSKFCQNCGGQIVKEVAVKNGEILALVPASQGLRLFNYVLDYIFYFIFTLIVSVPVITIIKIKFPDLEITPFTYGFSFGVLVTYYVLFESLSGKTLAKFITKTKVVTKQGRKPGFVKSLVRTLCRLIPFDNFSFLTKTNPIGWHDSIAGTIVIKDR